MRRKMLLVNLRLFDGEGGAGATAAAAAPAAEGTDTGSEAAEGQEAAEEEPAQPTPEERKAAYEKFKAEYKDLYSEEVQSAINRRYRENQQLHQQLDSYGQLLDLLGARYQVSGGKVEDIISAIEKDDAMFEEAAAKEGLTVQQYKDMLNLRRQNNQLLKAQQQAEQIRQRDQTWARWNREATECQQQFPGFDMDAECQNPEFVRLLGSGIDVTTAYKALHFDEINRGLIATAESQTKKKVADTIRSGAARPSENGTGNGAAAKLKVDVWKLSKEEFRKLQDRVDNDEKIVL